MVFASFDWVALDLLRRLTQDRFDIPNRCPCGGDVEPRGPDLVDCCACGRLLTRADLAVQILDDIVAAAIHTYPEMPAAELRDQLLAALDAHCRAMALVKEAHFRLVGGPPQEGLSVEIAHTRALGRDESGALTIPTFEHGHLAAADVVAAHGGVTHLGSAAAAQILIPSGSEDVLVTPRGLTPLLAHHLGGVAVLGLYPRDTDARLAEGLPMFRTALLLPGFDNDRRWAVTEALLSMGVEVRIAGDPGGDWWSSSAVIRTMFEASTDFVADQIGCLRVGDYGYELARLKLQMLIAVMPDCCASRRDFYVGELARVTKRRRRAVEADIRRSAAGSRSKPKVLWSAATTRPLRLGQDYAAGRLIYTEEIQLEHGLGKDLALVTSEREIIPIWDRRVVDLGLDPLVDLPSQMPSRWSQDPAAPNSMPRFLDGGGETSLATVVDDLETTIRRRVWFRDPLAYIVIATTIVATYLCALAATVPYLFLVGLKRTGKTLLLEALEALCFNARIGLPTRASSYRLTHFTAATLVIDEVKRSVPVDFLAMLKSGYRRDGNVIIVSGGSPRSFNTSGVKILAGTKGFDDELLDRGVVLLCERKEQQVENLTPAEFEESTRSMRDRLHCVALSRAWLVSEYLDARSTAGNLRGREREIFLLPAAIACAADEEDDGDRWRRLMKFARRNEAAKVAVVTSGVDVHALLEAVHRFCLGTAPIDEEHPSTHIAADVAAHVAAAMGKPKLTAREVGAELVRAGVLAPEPSARPKLHVRGAGATRACWVIKLDRVRDVARSLGVTLPPAEHRPTTSGATGRETPWIRELSPTEIAAIPLEKVRALSADEVRSMFRDQIEALRPDQVRAFTPERLASFDQEPFLTWLTPTQATAMSSTQARALLEQVGLPDFFGRRKRLTDAVVKVLKAIVAGDDSVSGEHDAC